MKRRERTGLFVALLSTGLVGCPSEPCEAKLGYGEVPEVMRAAANAFPDHESVEVCGFLGEHVYIRGPKVDDPESLTLDYYQRLEQAGFERVPTGVEAQSKTLSTVWGDPRHYVRDDTKLEAQARGGRQYQVMLRDLSEGHREELSKQAAHAKAQDARAEVAKSVASWIESVRPAVAALRGTVRCTLAEPLSPRPPIIDLESFEQFHETKGRSPSTPCAPMLAFDDLEAPLSGSTTGEDGRACRDLLSGQQPVTFLVWSEDSLRYPSMPTKRGGDSGVSTFTAGTFEGRVVIWDPTTSTALCHAPVHATSSRRLESLEVRRGNQLISDDSMDVLAEDLHTQIVQAATKAYAELLPS